MVANSLYLNMIKNMQQTNRKFYYIKISNVWEIQNPKTDGKSVGSTYKYQITKIIIHKYISLDTKVYFRLIDKGKQKDKFIV